MGRATWFPIIHMATSTMSTLVPWHVQPSIHIILPRFSLQSLRPCNVDENQHTTAVYETTISCLPFVIFASITERAASEPAINVHLETSDSIEISAPRATTSTKVGSHKSSNIAREFATSSEQQWSVFTRDSNDFGGFRIRVSNVR